MGDSDYERLRQRLERVEHRLNAVSEYVLVGWLLGGSVGILFLGQLFGLVGTLIAAVILAVLWFFGLRALRNNLAK